MTDFWLSVLVIGGVGAVMVALAGLAHRLRRRGGAGPAIGAAMAAYDEAMHSTAYDTFVEAQAQGERKIPIPSPGEL